LPSPYFWEVAKKLLEHAQDDLMVDATYSPNELKSALDDLWSQRVSKIYKGLQVVTKSDMVYSVVLENIGIGELNSIRPLFVETLAQLRTLNSTAQNAGPAPQFAATTTTPSRQRVGSKSRRNY